MLLLTAYNRILPKLGEHPVTSVDSKSPTIGVIKPELEAQVESLCMAGWWFNEFDVTLYPNSEKQIDVPTKTLSFVPDRESGSVVQRGELFYNGVNRSYKFDTKVSGKIIQLLNFEELPESAAAFALYSATVTCYITDIGLEQVVQVWNQQKAEALALMESEHLKHRKYTIKQSRRFAHRRNAMRG